MSESAEQPSPKNLLPGVGEIAQAIAVIAALAYAGGFVTVFADLGRLGIRNFEAFRVQYLVAGAMYLLVVAVFAFIVGRHIKNLNSDYEKYLEILKKSAQVTGFWRLWLLGYTIVELVYLAVLSAVVTSAFLLLEVPPLRVIYLLVAIVTFHYIGDFVLTSNAVKAPGRRFFLLHGLFMALAVIGFIVLVQGLYWRAFAATVVAATALNGYYLAARYHPHPRALASYYAIFWFLVGAGYFGSQFYAHIRGDVGGGGPQKVRLVIARDKLPVSITTTLGITNSTSDAVDLIADTTDVAVVGVPAGADPYKEVVSINRAAIDAIISKPQAPRYIVK